MTTSPGLVPGVTEEFITRLADRAGEAERLRRLPRATLDDYRASGLASLLLPARYGGRQAEFPEILDPIRRMAHGCASSAWTLGFYTLHNWMLALFVNRFKTRCSRPGRCCARRRWPRPGAGCRPTAESGSAAGGPGRPG
ncbi:Flavin-dependent monooxygenase, oxygenase subunit HsaA [Mycobacterium talmoniae]|uniref:Flavin-dependent monooxygenase, oxygenase subunit HsaA n=1 Tax=Mycobacterium talmoniae TaxID=1858794 RepID=A0A2S8BLA7_9MYCO|nr:Flavin-dependent monooxygenase, oxygenase subunit HsaA [Mycobacterium talmoniae]